MDKEIIDQLGEYIRIEIMRQPDRTIAADEALITGGLIDSFSLVDLAVFIEEKFGVQIDDTELNAATFDTLDQLSKLILSRQK